MKKAFLVLAGCLFPIEFAFGQPDDNSIKMISTYSSENLEVSDILAFEKIDYYKIVFAGSSLIDKNYFFIVKEIWNGEITKIDTLINTAKNARLGKLNSDSLKVRIMAKKASDNKLKMSFRFPRLGMESTFKAIDSDDYSLRDIGRNLKIEPNEPFYALAYILPYEKDGYKMYCDVEYSDINVEKWGKTFGIVHYILFEMKFE